MYPVPFNKLVSDINYRYENYSKVLPSLPYVLTGDIPRFENQTSDILMITGASHNHQQIAVRTPAASHSRRYNRHSCLR